MIAVYIDLGGSMYVVCWCLSSWRRKVPHSAKDDIEQVRSFWISRVPCDDIVITRSWVPYIPYPLTESKVAGVGTRNFVTTDADADVAENRTCCCCGCRGRCWCCSASLIFGGRWFDLFVSTCLFCLWAVGAVRDEQI